MTVVVGKFHHEDGSYDLAIAETSDGTDGYKTVVSFPESSGEKQVTHDVPRGTDGGKFTPA